MNLRNKIRDRLAREIRKHELCPEENIENYINTTINKWDNIDLLEAISLELEEI